MLCGSYRFHFCFYFTFRFIVTPVKYGGSCYVKAMRSVTIRAYNNPTGGVLGKQGID